MNRLGRHTSLFVLVSAAVLCFFLRLCAQQAGTPTISYEGQQVSAVEVAGRPDLNTKQLKQLIVQPEDAPYSQQKVDQSIAALKQAGKFTSVQLEVTPQANGLQILFVVQPALYFGVFDFGDASKVFTYNRLLQVANYPTQEPYSAGRVEE